MDNPWCIRIITPILHKYERLFKFNANCAQFWHMYYLCIYLKGTLHCNIQIVVFWIVMLCSVVIGYQHFRGPCWHHLHTYNGGSMVHQNTGLYHTTHHHNPEDLDLNHHHCENLISCTITLVVQGFFCSLVQKCWEVFNELV
jgi:hypothetical protein